MGISEYKLAKKLGFSPETLRLWRVQYFNIKSPGRGRSINYTDRQKEKIVEIVRIKREYDTKLRAAFMEFNNG